MVQICNFESFDCISVGLQLRGRGVFDYADSAIAVFTTAGNQMEHISNFKNQHGSLHKLFRTSLLIALQTLSITSWSFDMLSKLREQTKCNPARAKKLLIWRFDFYHTPYSYEF